MVVLSSIGAGLDGISSRSAGTTGTINNFRVIKLVELSPSADFSSGTGFTLAGGVTISGGQAVFGSGAGSKQVGFSSTAKLNTAYRVKYTVTGGTTGRFRAMFSTADGAQAWQTANGTYDVEITTTQASSAFSIATDNGWDGNITEWSVTEVTDATTNGSPLNNFENYWLVQNSDKLSPSSAGVLSLGRSYLLDTANTYLLPRALGAVKGDRLIITRINNLEPTVSLDSADIAAGVSLLINNTASPSNNIIIDDDVMTSIFFNGTDYEVRT